MKFIVTEIPQIIDIRKFNSNGIEIPYPLFFGNLKKDPHNPNEYRKFSFLNEPFKAVFLSYIEELHKVILEYIADFFMCNNFGTRQSKGFGSFYLDTTEESKPYYHKPKSDLCFIIETDNFLDVFDRIDLFYRSLRGGLNLKRIDRKRLDECGNPTMIDVFYFKSLLFMYGRHKGIQWEKKKIKEEFFLKSYIYDKKGKDYLSIGLTEQQKIRNGLKDKDHYPLFYKSENVFLLKDLLGLSSNESWKSYDDVITKTEAALVDEKYVKIKQESKLNIARIKSPLLFKIFKTRERYHIFIIIDKEMEKVITEQVLGKTFILGSTETGAEFPLSFPKSFSLSDFFAYILKGDSFNIEDHVEIKFQGRNEFNILKNIYGQLKANYK